MASSAVESPSEYLRTVERAFETANAVPLVKSAMIENEAQFTVVYSQPSVAEGKTINYATTFTDDPDVPATEDRQNGFTRTMPQTLAENTLQATRGDLRVEVFKTKNEKGDEIEVIHVFRGGRMERSLNLTDRDLHGKVYFDAEFGCLSVSPDLKAVVFVAEEKKEANRPYLKAKPAPSAGKSNGGDGKEELRGQESLYRGEFGEQMVGKSTPVIVQLYLEDYDLKVRSGIPEGWAPGQLSFLNNDTLVGIATETKRRRLGVVYCSNRLGVLFRLDKEGDYEVIRGSEDLGIPQSPRVSPGGEWLVWLERDLGKLKGLSPGPHATCMRLMKLGLNGSGGPEEVIPVRDGGDIFFGLYMPLPRRPFSTCGRFLLLSTYGLGSIRSVICDLKVNEFDYIESSDWSLSITDVYHNKALGVLSGPDIPPTILKCNLNTASDIRLGQRVPFKAPAEREETRFPNIETLLFGTGKEGHPEPNYAHVPNSGFLILPTNRPSPAPLILWPHGGPHSAVMATFIPQAYFFNLLGYAVCFVNYRGSLGAGTDSIASVMGNIGDTDVKDCHAALKHCLEKHPNDISADDVYLMGGSHGGFLVTHLIGQYPDIFKGCAARNPVTNIAAMPGVSDIPDWCFNEAGMSFDYQPPDPDQMRVMYEKSPIAHVKKVKTPVMLNIGKVDLRVPPSQGHEYYHALKALGKYVEMHVYDDNHPLAKVPVNANVMINTAMFFYKIRNGLLKL